MCNFFSLLSSGDGRVYGFSPAQQISIAKLYGLDEDEYDKRKYDLFNGGLVLDMQLTADDRKVVLEEIKKINFDFICGNVEGAREFIRCLKTMKFLDGHGDIPDGVKMFETKKEARHVAFDAAMDIAKNTVGDVGWDTLFDDEWDDALDVAQDAVFDAAYKAAWVAARDASWKAARDAAKDTALVAAWGTVCDAVKDAIEVSEYEGTLNALLFVYLIYVCSGLPIDQKHIDHIKKRWAVWEAGYGVSYDVDGVLYCYKNN